MRAVWLQRGCADFEAVERFISTKIYGHEKRMYGDTAIVSVGADDLPKGAAVFQNYNAKHGTIEISAAAMSARWLSRAILAEMFGYAFDQLKCQAVVLLCDPDDKVMGRIASAYGFKRYDIPRLRGRDKAEAVFVLSDDDWRDNKFHKEPANG